MVVTLYFSHFGHFRLFTLVNMLALSVCLSISCISSTFCGLSFHQLISWWTEKTSQQPSQPSFPCQEQWLKYYQLLMWLKSQSCTKSNLRFYLVFFLNWTLCQYEKSVRSSLKFKSDSANENTLIGNFSSIVVGCSFFHSRKTCIHLGTAVIAKICTFHCEMCLRYLVGTWWIA